MNLAIIKPRSERVVRIETDLTAKDVQAAAAYNPKVLNLYEDNDSNAVSYVVEVKLNAIPQIGNRGVKLGFVNDDIELTQTVKVNVGSEAEFVALVSKTQERLATFEKNVKESLVALGKASETIKEV